MPALQILAAALLVFGSIVVFRVLIESDRMLEEASPLATHDGEAEEAESLRQAA